MAAAPSHSLCCAGWRLGRTLPLTLTLTPTFTLNLNLSSKALTLPYPNPTTPHPLTPTRLDAADTPPPQSGWEVVAARGERLLGSAAFDEAVVKP